MLVALDRKDALLILSPQYGILFMVTANIDEASCMSTSASKIVSGICGSPSFVVISFYVVTYFLASNRQFFHNPDTFNSFVFYANRLLLTSIPTGIIVSAKISVSVLRLTLGLKSPNGYIYPLIPSVCRYPIYGEHMRPSKTPSKAVDDTRSSNSFGGIRPAIPSIVL